MKLYLSTPLSYLEEVIIELASEWWSHTTSPHLRNSSSSEGNSWNKLIFHEVGWSSMLALTSLLVISYPLKWSGFIDFYFYRI